MNAAIQLLYSIPELRDFLSSFELNELNNNRLDERQKEFKNRLQALKLIFSKLTENGSDPNPPPIDLINMPLTLVDGTQTNIYDYFVKPEYIRNLKGQFENKNPFERLKFADCNEFILYLLDPFDELKNQKLEGILNKLQFNEITSLECENGKKPKIRDELQKMLSLPIKSSDNNIQEVINNYMEPEEYTEHTESCGTGRNEDRGAAKTKKIEIKILNNTHIIVMLKRFDRDGNKLTYQILPNQFIEIDNIRFRLIGCALHTPGHYRYFIYNNGRRLNN